MSRTLTQVALIGASVAANIYAPGIGQAIVTNLGRLGLSGLAGTVLAQTAVAALRVGTAAVTAAGVQAGAQLVGLGPKLPKPETTETAIKTSLPPRVTAYGRNRLYGAYILYETAPNGTAVDVMVFHEGRMDGIERYYLNDDEVTLAGSTVQPGDDGRYKEAAVNVYLNLGEPTETAFAAITSLLPSIWTADHRGDGCVTAALTAKAVKDKDFLETYPNGVPLLSIAGRWSRVYDWRDPAQQVDDPSTWAWSENAILHYAHFKMTRGRLNETNPLPIADWWAKRIEPQLSYWTAAADVCDEPVALKAGGTEARYRSCVAYKATDEPKNVEAELLTACDGWSCVMGDGSIRVFAGQYEAPTVSLGKAEIASFSLSDGIAEEQQADALIVTYVSEAHAFNTVDADPWLIRQGERTQPFAPQVPSHAQARRLAKRAARRAAQPLRGSITTTVAGRGVLGQRYVDVALTDDDDVTFYEGPVEIVSAVRDLESGGISFEYIVADDDIDQWDAEDEEGNPAPVGERVELEALEAPTIVTAEAVFDDESADGLSGARIAIIGTGPDRDDLTWYYRWRGSEDDPWVEGSAEDTDPASPVALLTGFVPVGIPDLQVQIAYEVGDGRRSPWSL